MNPRTVWLSLRNRSQEHSEQLLLALVSVIVGIIVLVLLGMDLVLFLVFLATVMLLRYFKRLFVVPFETAPILFFTLVLTHLAGLKEAIVFVIAAQLIGGAISYQLGPLEPVWVIKSVLAALLFSVLGMPLLTGGLLIVSVDAALTMLFKWKLMGAEEVPAEAAVFVLNAVAFLTLGRIILLLA